MSETMTTIEAARALELSTDRTRELDGVLQPTRDASNHRIYRRDVVRAYRAMRAARRGAS